MTGAIDSSGRRPPPPGARGETPAEAAWAERATRRDRRIEGASNELEQRTLALRPHDEVARMAMARHVSACCVGK